MRVTKYLILLLLLMTILNETLKGETNDILEVVRTDDKGNDPDSCLYAPLEFHFTNTPSVELQNKRTIKLTIAGDPQTIASKFPWQVRVLNSDGMTVTQSRFINASDFYQINSTNDLRRTSVEIEFTIGAIHRSGPKDCLFDENGDSYSLLPFEFKIYSIPTNSEVPSDLILFSNPNLTQGSSSLIKYFRTCQCLSPSPRLPMIAARGSFKRQDINLKAENYLEFSGYKESYDKEQININISPNPFMSVVDINVRTDNQGTITMKIMDLQGSLILEEHIRPQIKSRIDLNHLANGIYIVAFRLINGDIISKRIIKI